MSQTEINRVSKESDQKMLSAFDAVKKQFATIRTGRAHPSLIESVKVDYYGSKTPLKQLASVTVPEPRLLVIQPWDKGSMSAIEKSILASDLGITPTNDGKFIRLAMPQLTHERRDELVKVLHKMSEEGRVSIRNTRHQANEEAAKLEKDKLVTEDDKFTAKEKVQKLTDEYIKKIDSALTEKEKEILG